MLSSGVSSRSVRGSWDRHRELVRKPFFEFCETLRLHEDRVHVGKRSTGYRVLNTGDAPEHHYDTTVT